MLGYKKSVPDYYPLAQFYSHREHPLGTWL